MSGRWILAVSLLVLAGGFWCYSRLIKKDSKNAGDLPAKGERWTGLGQLAASGMGITLLISPSVAIRWGWAPALAACVIGGILFGAALNLGAACCLTGETSAKEADPGKERSPAGWKRKTIAFLIWLFAILAAAAAGHTAAASWRGFATGESGELLRNSVGAAGAASCVILCVAAAGLGIVCRYRKISLPVKAAAVFLLICDAAWLGKTYPIYLGETVWLAVVFLLAFFTGIIPAWVQTRPRGQMLLILEGIVLAAGCAGILLGDPRPAAKAITVPDGSLAGLQAFFAIVLWGTVSGFDAAALAVSPLRYQKSEAFKKSAVGSGLLKSFFAVLGLLLSFALTGADAAAMGLEEAPQFFAAAAAGLLAEVGIPYDFTIALFLMAACSFLLAVVDAAVRMGTLAFREITRRDGKMAGWSVGAAATILPAFGAALLARHGVVGVWTAVSFAAVLLLLPAVGVRLRRQGKKGRRLWVGAVLLAAGALAAAVLPMR